MQQFRSFSRFLAFPVLFLVLALTLTACGGGGSSSGGGTGTKVVITPAPSVSLNSGQVFEVIAFVQDTNNTNLGNKITWTSSDTNLLSLAPDGSKCGGDTSTNTNCLCAGKWDTNIITCTPATASGAVTLTATSDALSSTITVFVHPKVARVTISTPVTDCTSSTGTVQATAAAFDADGNPVTVSPTDQTGFSFQTSDGNVVTSDTKGLLTAVNPGKANIYAAVSNVTSTPVPFTTCGVKKINLHVKDVTDTSFTVDKGTTKTLVADVVDTKDKTITIANTKLTFTSSNNGIVTVDQAGAVNTLGAGSSSIVVACSAPNCNTGLNSVFSNPVIANVNGNSATQVIALSTTSTSLFPIDTATGTVGTAVTLPANPNSMVFARTGLGAYIGTDSSLLAYDNTKGAAVAIANVPGKVIGVSNDGGMVVIFDNSTNKVTTLTYNGTSATGVDQFVVAGIPNPCETTDQCPRASFTPDSRTAYIVAGSNLYVSTANASLKTFPLGQPAKDVAVSEQGSFTYVANGNNSVDVYATCNNGKLGSNSVALAAIPQRIASSVDATKIYAITAPTLNVISPTSDFTGCPPSLTDPLATFDLGQSTFNTKQLLVSSNGAKVAMITDTNKVVIYNASDNSGAAVTLSGGATVTTGAMTLDGASLYVGGSDKAIHKIDLATNTDAQQITLTITPDIVAVKTK